MKRKFLMLTFFGLLIVSNGLAQFQRSVFNHLSVNVGAGTEGIGVGVAAPLTNFLEFEAGVNFMPGCKVNANVNLEADGTLNVQGQEIEIPDARVKVSGNFARTTYNVKANIYPFGGNSHWFLAAGFSFGGAKIANLNGHSDELMDFINQYPDYKQEILDRIGVELADYKLKLDDNCDINGDIRCNSFRPYLGMGFGRLVPRNRLGFRVELGCQFMGTLKVYQNGEKLDIHKILEDATGDKNTADNISKFIENWNIYPVLKFQLVGRIL